MSLGVQLALEDPLTALPGIGASRVEPFARLNIFTIGGLLQHRPRRYEDRRALAPISQLEAGQSSTVQCTVEVCGTKYARHRTKSVFEMIVTDGSARLHCRWWNLPYMERYFKTGDRLFIHGKVRSLRPRTMDHPETEKVEEGEESIHLLRIVPVYPLTEGIPQRYLRRLVSAALASLGESIPDPWGGLIPKEYPQLSDARRWIHFPEEWEQIEKARRRLALDEWLELQKEILLRRARLEARARIKPCVGDNHLIRPFLKQLGFTLTPEQTGVLQTIRADLKSGAPMRRLLQGDVGSGKTVVAACALLMAMESGLNTALMAPTEILAGQHAGLFRRWFAPLGLGVSLLTSSHPLTAEESGSAKVRLTIGTHALIQEQARFDRLGLVVIDEQHRFGVAQREAIIKKGQCPHLLCMTATPIPRTLALAVYGDLDVSLLRGHPPGRGKIRTYLRRQSDLGKVWAFVKTRLEAGDGAYVIYPLVEESEESSLLSVKRNASDLATVLAPFQVGLMHGRLSSESKETTMAAFASGKLQVLASTTVVEVGVDVPEATVIVILDADRFGLAQLHQLRGRVGRGARASVCVLATASDDPEAMERLQVLERTSDGFELAEADLRIRGPGEFLGRSQSGVPPFRFASLETDLELAQLARELLHSRKQELVKEAGAKAGGSAENRS